jgi:hypothetical protein
MNEKIEIKKKIENALNYDDKKEYNVKIKNNKIN